MIFSTGDILFIRYYLLTSLIAQQILNQQFYTAIIVFNLDDNTLKKHNLGLEPGCYTLTFTKNGSEIVKIDNILKNPLIQSVHIRRVKVPSDIDSLLEKVVKLQGLEQENVSNFSQIVLGTSKTRQGKMCSEILAEILSLPESEKVPLPDDFITCIPNNYHPIEFLLERKLSTTSLQTLHRMNTKIIENHLLYQLFPNCVDLNL